MKVWIDGAVVDAAQARIPVTDHGVLYGDGVFEGIRAYGRRVFRLDEHLARLRTSSRAIGLTLPMELSAIREVVLDTLRAFDHDDAYLRLVVTRGEGALGVDPTTCPLARVFCIAAEARIYPEEKLRDGLDLVTSSLRRPPGGVLDPRVKSLNYLNNALAKQEARRQGADEALLLNLAGSVAEASVANVFAVLRGRLATPPASDGALQGVVRGTVLELAPGLGLEPCERSLDKVDLFGADEVFLSGTGAGLVPVRSLDGQPVGEGKPGPVWACLREAFLGATRSGVAF